MPKYYRMPLPRGSALGRALPLVAYRPVVPRVEVPRVVPRDAPEYLGVGFDDTVLGGCSTNDVSVVLFDNQQMKHPIITTKSLT